MRDARLFSPQGAGEAIPAQNLKVKCLKLRNNEAITPPFLLFSDVPERCHRLVVASLLSLRRRKEESSPRYGLFSRSRRRVSSPRYGLFLEVLITRR